VQGHLTYTIHIERDEHGLYVVSVAALPGCFTQCRTFDEAMAMAQDAIAGFVATLVARGKSVPIERSAESPFSMSVAAPLRSHDAPAAS